MDRVRFGEAVRNTTVPDGAVRAVAGRAESIEGMCYAAASMSMRISCPRDSASYQP